MAGLEPGLEIDFSTTIARMAQETETAFALIMASRTEDWLQAAIEAKMRKLTNNEKADV